MAAYSVRYLGTNVSVHKKLFFSVYKIHKILQFHFLLFIKILLSFCLGNHMLNKNLSKSISGKKKKYTILLFVNLCLWFWSIFLDENRHRNSSSKASSQMKPGLLNTGMWGRGLGFNLGIVSPYFVRVQCHHILFGSAQNDMV